MDSASFDEKPQTNPPQAEQSTLNQSESENNINNNTNEVKQ